MQARHLVVPPHRQGGQAQFIEQPLPETACDDRLSDLFDWVRANLDQAHSLDSLADKVLMSRRSFTRHFRQLTGTTVGGWLLAEWRKRDGFIFHALIGRWLTVVDPKRPVLMTRNRAGQGDRALK